MSSYPMSTNATTQTITMTNFSTFTTFSYLSPPRVGDRYRVSFGPFVSNVYARLTKVEKTERDWCVEYVLEGGDCK